MEGETQPNIITMQQFGKYIIFAGIILVIIGAIMWLFGDKLGWFGNLPGDIKIKKDNFSFYAPITSMFLFSVVLSFIIWLVSKIK
jgi:magnesium-transporting ATPase (P-type)